VKFSREWAMPDPDTFNVKPIRDFVWRYLSGSKVSVEPFARNNIWATYTNDIDPETKAASHLDAEEFMKRLARSGTIADLIILDPPYSPRQISECYERLGLKVGMMETQSAVLYQRVRHAAASLCGQGAVVLSFGWNSVGMGTGRGFEIEEILLVCHGGAHNDTICLAERRLPTLL
jgi:hypothetical protein